jgi:hypothetical protein
MTSHTGKNRSAWRRAVTGAVAGGALAVGLMVGLGAVTALAEPADPTTQTDTPPTMTADEALAIIATDYDMGAGGGQLSNLIHEVLVLRAQGFYPSNSNKQAIEKALDYRPNQKPLIDALQDTLAYQRKLQAQSLMQGQQQQSPFVMGINQPPPGIPQDPTEPNNGGVFISPGGAVQQPIP